MFLGDADATPNNGDIVGFQTHASVGETDIMQSAKVTAPGVLAAFAAQLDGKYATGLCRPARRAWQSGRPNLWAVDHSEQPRAATTPASRKSWAVTASRGRVREGIEPNTANGDFLAFIGPRSRASKARPWLPSGRTGV